MNNTIRQVRRALNNSHGGMQTTNMTINRQYIVELVSLAEFLLVAVEQMGEELAKAAEITEDSNVDYDEGKGDNTKPTSEFDAYKNRSSMTDRKWYQGEDFANDEYSSGDW